MSAKNKSPLLEKGVVLNEKWEILEHIATGGMAEVYRARQIELDREVAVKVLSQEFLDSFEGDALEIEVALERFHREVKAMAQVRHQNVLQVYDQGRSTHHRHGEEQSIEYIAMEYISGPNLRSTMPPEGMRANEKDILKWIRNYFLPILDGVKTVHTRGIVHRDLKPENVLIDGVIPKITDFGLAAGARWKPVTQSHHIAGTAPYQAPEQFIDMAETDVRADIYSLGKILYELIAGKMDKKPALFWKSARLDNPDTPFLKRLDRIVQQATAEEKGQRIPSIQILRQAVMEAIEEGEKCAAAAGVGGIGLRRFGIRKLSLLLALLLAVVAVSILFHVFYHRERAILPGNGSVISSSESTQGQVSDVPRDIPHQASSSPLASVLVGRDGSTLRLVSGGEVFLAETNESQAGRSVKVNAFFLDETEVTNHQYVGFLNQVMTRVMVEGDVVRGDGNVWLLLGEVIKGYEPIVFRDQRFFINDPRLHSHPVVRVTAYGAAAYARFYGRRLPTEAEWLRAMGKEDDTPGKPTSSPESSAVISHMEKMHKEANPSSAEFQPSSEGPVPVVNSKPNAYGIRGLEGNVSEWAVSLENAASQREQGPRYVILPEGVSRHPWEAFEQVGFRTALDAPAQGK